jgi:acyl carrier protein
MNGAPPSRDVIFVALKGVLSGHFGLRPEQVVPSARLAEDLELDSIDWIDLAVKLEVETGEKLEESDLESIRTIEDVVGVVHRRLGGRASTDA